MRGYATFAAAAQATGLATGATVYVGGTTVLGDSGAGWFGFRTPSALTPGADVIAVTSGGQLLRLTKSASMTLEYDSAGNPMPAGMGSTFGRVDGRLVSVSKTNGVDTWTKTYSYDGADVAGVSGWVKA